VDRGVVIITVAGVGHVTGRCAAGLYVVGPSSEAITVAIKIEGAGQAFVNNTVAVVIETVADFTAPGIGCSTGIVTVSVVKHIAGGLAAGIGIYSGLAKAVTIVVQVISGGLAFIDTPIAVVIDTITGLPSAGVHLWISVVAVDGPANTAVDVVAVAVDVRAAVAYGVTVLIKAVGQAVQIVVN
jgi:hypothetical protein